MNPKRENKAYVICIRGKLDQARCEWFGAMELEHTKKGNTIIRGDILDQSALFGVIEKIRDMGMELISVRLSG